MIANPTKEVKGVRRKVEVWKDEANTASTVLLVSNVPSNCTHDQDFLGAELEKSLELELDENFFLSAHGDSSVLVTFKKSLSSQGESSFTYCAFKRKCVVNNWKLYDASMSHISVASSQTPMGALFN